MTEFINIKIEENTYSIKKGSTLEEISKLVQEKFKYPILVGKVNNSLKELNYKINKPQEIEFYDLTKYYGNKVHVNGLIFILLVAIKELYGKDKDIVVNHSLDKGFYIESKFDVNEQIINEIKLKMQEIITANYEIKKVIVERLEAIKYFESVNDLSKVEILKYNTNSYVTLYHLNEYYNYLYTKMPIRTGLVRDFELNYIQENGFMLRFPTVYVNDKIPEYIHHEDMFKVFSECKIWNKLINIENASDLNKVVSKGKINELIRICEHKQNSDFIEISNRILKKDTAKIILMAGPSSSGKTTSSKKLCMALKTLGKNPAVLSMDDYFVDRNETPLDENGKPDFECLEAVDLKLFDDQIAKLLRGEPTVVPTYNFIEGKKEYKKELILGENDLLVIEGIHALDNKILLNIPNDKKFKIYVSALTELNVDNHNRVSTTDNRLLRRIVRDSKTRGKDVEYTLAGWHSVRLGEEKYIFPFQDEEDYILNTALLYEIGVLKTYVEPLLYAVESDSPHYPEAKRLIDFLRNFLPIPADAIPQDSVLREFIGGSCFKEE